MEYNGNKLRHEIKYLITAGEYILLSQVLKPILQLDKNAIDKGEYKIRSLYFDDIYNTALKEKESGIARRTKYRIRAYDDNTSLIMLEKKEKFDELISKRSVKLTMEQYKKIINKDYSWLAYSDNSLLREFFIQISTKLLQPKIIVDYDREPYVMETGNVRITFDKNLRVTSHGNVDIFDENVTTYTIMNNEQMILEVKYDDYLPAVVQDLIQVINKTPSANSKYVLGRDFQYGVNWRG